MISDRLLKVLVQFEIKIKDCITIFALAYTAEHFFESVWIQTPLIFIC